MATHFRLDVLSAFFLAVVNLAGAAASFYAIGYGAREEHPARILPFYPAFLAGMNLVILADDAFSFLVAWEFMSLSSWALVLAHHHDAENRRAAFIYLLMASFGTLALLMAFGLLAGSVGGYDFSAIRAGAAQPDGVRVSCWRWCSSAPDRRRGLCRCTSGCRSRIRRRRATFPR